MLYCSVCQDVINDNSEDHAWVLQCGHIFHKKCMPLTITNYNCPQCRVGATSWFRIYPTIMSGDETLVLMRNCVDAAELMYNQQTAVLKEKDVLTRTLTDQIEQCHARIQELTSSFTDYMRQQDERTGNLNNKITTQRELNETLRGELTISTNRLSEQHESALRALETQHKREKEQLVQSLNRMKHENEAKLKEQVESLIGQLDKVTIQIVEANLKYEEKETENAELEEMVDTLRILMSQKDEEIVQISQREPEHLPLEPFEMQLLLKYREFERQRNNRLLKRKENPSSEDYSFEYTAINNGVDIIPILSALNINKEIEDKQD